MNTEKEDFQVFIKPAGSKCNLGCSYCYYLGKGYDSADAAKTMPVEIMEKYIADHIKYSPGPEIFFSWHGGEPLLAGTGFYKKAIEIQQRHKPASCTIHNGIQTNGTLIDEEWCRFLAANNFYVGVSIDGPGKIHDTFRQYVNGTGSSEKAVRGYKMIRQAGIMNEILCVVSRENVTKPLEVYRFLKELGTGFITFLPLVIRDTSSPGKASEISVPSAAFGEFLTQIFDEWVSKDIGRIRVQIFEEAVTPAFGREHTLCIFKKTCGRVPVIDMNGDFYSCDHYVDNNHRIGNIMTSSFGGMLDSEAQKAFGRAKLELLPRYCLECDVREFCNGECPKNRFIETPAGEPGLNYLCQGYKIFFHHIKPFVDAVRAEWRGRNPEAK